ncbi:hypothetical protein ACAG39_11165 [Caldicellulosiruptoraceae bacterium PP1]
MKVVNIIPELLALIGGFIIFILCINLRKSGEYTFIVTFAVSVVLYGSGKIIKDILKDDDK